MSSKRDDPGGRRTPYAGLGPAAFWRTGVSEQDPRSPVGLYKPRFRIDPDWAVATAGSCFAQHIARHLRKNGYNVLDVEPPPPGLKGEAARALGYDLYSARYGNIYHPRQLLQLIRESFGQLTPGEVVWEKDGRFFDALRPAVDPDGFATAEGVLRSRLGHLTRVKEMMKAVDLFVFTLGLTEAWVHRESGTVFPTAPGVIAGSYDPDVYELQTFTHAEVLRDLITIRAILKRVRPDSKLLLTVSPVPLAATATDQHVLVATTQSKSVLRAAAGEVCQRFDDVDYFPSYELFATPFSRGAFFEDDLRTVRPEAVETVMRVFFDQHGVGPERAAVVADDEDDAVICEDELLAAFG